MNPIRPPYRVAVVLTVALGLAACGAPQRGGGLPTGPTIRAEVAVVAATEQPRYSEAPGTVVAARTARIASRLSGYVRAIDVDVGDRVEAGQLLLTIDNRDVEAQVAQARAALAGARAAYADAAFNYERYSNLFRQQAVTGQEYQRTQQAYATARAGVSAAASATSRESRCSTRKRTA